jgi:hypothetical protein
VGSPPLRLRRSRGSGARPGGRPAAGGAAGRPAGRSGGGLQRPARWSGGGWAGPGPARTGRGPLHRIGTPGQRPDHGQMADQGASPDRRCDGAGGGALAPRRPYPVGCAGRRVERPLRIPAGGQAGRPGLHGRILTGRRSGEAGWGPDGRGRLRSRRAHRDLHPGPGGHRRGGGRRGSARGRDRPLARRVRLRLQVHARSEPVPLPGRPGAGGGAGPPGSRPPGLHPSPAPGLLPDGLPPLRRRASLPAGGEYPARIHRHQPGPQGGGCGRDRFETLCTRLVEAALDRGVPR